ncbi:MAG: tripartite tricarboxylate transporter TctB family protein [Nonomuraea sp.]|nr:tripartite tricarboxylate transporter TctB family protein [Nonomuraea sp.]
MIARWWRPELALALVVLGLGVFVVLGTLDVSAAASQLGVGPRFFPMLVGGAMIVVGALYVVDVLRGGHGDPEEGEDVDLQAATDWRSMLLLGGVFLAFTAVLEFLGWIIAATLLFWGVALVLGAEHRIRAGIVAAVLGVSTYLLFVMGLGVTLPAGVLG